MNKESLEVVFSLFFAFLSSLYRAGLALAFFCSFFVWPGIVSALLFVPFLLLVLQSLFVASRSYSTADIIFYYKNLGFFGVEKRLFFKTYQSVIDFFHS